MTLNPATCPIGSKYYCQIFNTVGSPPPNWDLTFSHDPRGIEYSFGTSGYQTWSDQLAAWHESVLLKNTVDFQGVDLTKQWTAQVSVTMGMKGVCKILIGNILLELRRDANGYSYGHNGGLGSLPGGIIFDGVAIIKVHKYEVGSFGKYLYSINEP